ncbi:FAD-binding oxidoreductase [Chelativorans alearense]|uniref:FAD-binding oxidoreductase n=1 Tax=Chelativorans alearense TaxID=2681495 RepID=UPI0013D02B0B|nr:FAD-binding oxidoreductase [Chelativorans alearense]
MSEPIFQTAEEELAAALEPGSVLVGDEIPERYWNDWSSLSASKPAVLLRPRTTEEVSVAMNICHARGIPVVPQGGLTGLSGGARPVEGCVALSMERMNGIVEIDPASATITVWAGTPLQNVQAAADESGFYFALDLGARGSCAIGGNVSTNAGGNRVIRYGMARDMVLGMEVVLPDGTIVSNPNKMLKNNSGYDLRQLFIGSEGTLGVITKLVLRLFPKPACTFAALCGLPDYDAVLRLLSGARRKLGPTLSAFEVMWPDYWEIATGKVPNVRDPLSGKHTFYVLVESQGTDERLDGQRFEAFMEEEFEAGSIADAAISQSMSDVEAFWRTRDAAADFKLVLGNHMAYDIGLPVKDMDAYASRCRAQLAKALPGCIALFYGHIGDGNMHIVSCVPGAERLASEEMNRIVYGLVRDFGGTISAEHGIGLTKKPYLHVSRTPEELELMRRVKRALDPTGMLNPGKILDIQ